MKYKVTTYLKGNMSNEHTEIINASFIDIKDGSYIIYQSKYLKGHYENDFYKGYVARFLPVQNTIIELVKDEE